MLCVSIFLPLPASETSNSPSAMGYLFPLVGLHGKGAVSM